MYSTFVTWEYAKKPSSRKSFREVGGRGREEAPEHPSGCSPSKLWDGTQPNRTVTYVMLKAMNFNDGSSTSATVRTILRKIIDMGFRRRRRTRVSLLTARHKALPLAWARRHRHWTVDDWKHVAWSDESHFQLNRADGRVREWRQSQESKDPTCQQDL
ncbi:HTH_Tnp_Tc3_2 domain-containing protein [Trichonephila clavipes]|nr:HTH_Tnp_Tc3_2 domain-containing protein [Trichonephila clavipes]